MVWYGKGHPKGCPQSNHMEAAPGFEPGVKALQASALPLGHFAIYMKRADVKPAPCMRWSGQRGSNPRPQPWQGCALPTEPCPLARKYYTQSDDNVQVIFHDCLRCWGDPWGRPDSDRLSSRARRDKSAPVPRRRVLAAGLVGLRESQASSSRSVRGNLRKTRD